MKSFVFFIKPNPIPQLNLPFAFGQQSQLSIKTVADPAEMARWEDTSRYIAHHWQSLTASLKNVLHDWNDPKLLVSRPHGPLLYIPPDVPQDEVARHLRKVLPKEAVDTIQLKTLPADHSQIKTHSLLYLPYPYVKPGGRFLEMYGWDSYFIQLGLIKDKQWKLSKHMTDNLLFQVQHYGKMLNGNRSYYLQRSQPPCLSDMVLNVYKSAKMPVFLKPWLSYAVRLIEKDYAYWTRPPHLVPELGLSRFYADGEGPTPDVSEGEIDENGLSHYDRVKTYFETLKDSPLITVSDYYDAQKKELTPRFYKADRSMRESGYDPSNRFGPLNADILNIIPVCLNCWLYRTERNLATLHHILGQKKCAEAWEKLAAARRDKINQTLWDSAIGLYRDYQFKKKELTGYPFATTFFALWAGVASAEQAQHLKNNLSLFEKQGGVVTSTQRSGNQWDAPYGWAPLQLVAVEGLRNYGYTEDADRLAKKFLNTVAHHYVKTGQIVEKYDVDSERATSGEELTFGYTSNEVGFGWTNGVFQHLYQNLLYPDNALNTALPRI